jgi:hypothetical protein
MTDTQVFALDGGLSTALEAQGLAIDGAMWTGELLLSNPEAVTAAHRSFVVAGADIIITGSYQLSFEGGRRAGWTDDDVERALRNSTAAARLAALRRADPRASLPARIEFFPDAALDVAWTDCAVTGDGKLVWSGKVEGVPHGSAVVVADTSTRATTGAAGGVTAGGVTADDPSPQAASSTMPAYAVKRVRVFIAAAAGPARRGDRPDATWAWGHRTAAAPLSWWR